MYKLSCTKQKNSLVSDVVSLNKGSHLEFDTTWLIGPDERNLCFMKFLKKKGEDAQMTSKIGEEGLNSLQKNMKEVFVPFCRDGFTDSYSRHQRLKKLSCCCKN